MTHARPDFVLHHMALAVHDIEASTVALAPVDYVLAPGFEPFIVDEELGVKLRFLVPRSGGSLLELVQGISERSPVAKILSKSGVTLYHTCFEVPDIATATESLHQKGYISVSRRVPAKAFGGRTIQFLYHKDSGLVELLSAL